MFNTLVPLFPLISLTSSQCKECQLDTYSSELGKSSKADCKPCDIQRSTGTSKSNVDPSACLCKKTFFYTDVDGTCAPCLDGANCSDKDGVVLSELTAKTGHWRANTLTKDFTDCKTAFSSSLDPKKDAEQRCCPIDAKTNVSICARNFSQPDDQCRDGYGGPSCMACRKGYAMTGSECKKCNPSVGKVAIAVAGLLAFLFLVFVVLFLKAKAPVVKGDDGKKGCCGGINQKKKPAKKQVKKTKEQKIEETRGTSAASRLVGDQVLIERMRTSDNSGGDTAYRSDSQVVIDRIKVFYGWLQIFTVRRGVSISSFLLLSFPNLNNTSSPRS